MKLIKTILIISVLILTGCTKTICSSYGPGEMDCQKKLDWNDPKFTIVRTIITNGANAGK